MKTMVYENNGCVYITHNGVFTPSQLVANKYHVIQPCTYTNQILPNLQPIVSYGKICKLILELGGQRVGNNESICYGVCMRQYVTMCVCTHCMTYNAHMYSVVV